MMATAWVLQYSIETVPVHHSRPRAMQECKNAATRPCDNPTQQPLPGDSVRTSYLLRTVHAVRCPWPRELPRSVP
jgi:hypothetical protein